MRVGVIQVAFTGDRDSMREKCVKAIREAKSKGANLVILPELHESHYFCINESVENFDLAKDFKKSKEFWSDVAKSEDVVLVTSLFEERVAGIYHNTAVVFDRDGSEAGFYRKMHIPDDPGFYEKFYFTPGDKGFEPIDTSVGRLGVLVCWDQWFPEAARIMALKGAEILIYPTAIGWFDEDEEDEKSRQLNSWINIQISHSIANTLPVVAVNRVGFEKDSLGAIEGIRFWGNSFAVECGGEVIFRADTKEMIEVVEFDRKKGEDIRKIWPFFRDRRVEYYGELDQIYIDSCEKK
jgi:N-carbamoylputrescine amidase